MSSSCILQTGITLLAVVSGLVGADPASADTTLRYKFKKGEKLDYVIEQKITTIDTAGGREFTTNMTQTIDLTWSVSDVDADGKAKLTQTCTRIRFRMDGPVGKVEYDSKDDKEPEGQLAKRVIPALKILAGSEMSFSMDAQGRISDLKLPEKFIEMTKKLAASPGGPPAEMLTEEGIKQIMDQRGLLLPKEPVRKGSTWSQKLETKSPFGKMLVESVNTYQGSVQREGRELDRIVVSPKFTIESEIFKLKSQNANGAAYFDNATGRLVETVMTQDLETEANIMGQVQTEKAKVTASLKLVK